MKRLVLTKYNIYVLLLSLGRYLCRWTISIIRPVDFVYYIYLLLKFTFPK